MMQSGHGTGKVRERLSGVEPKGKLIGVAAMDICSLECSLKRPEGAAVDLAFGL